MSVVIGTLNGQAAGCDSDTAISSEAEAACLNTLYQFIGRYISNTSTEQPGDLDSTEINNIINGGLYLAIIQHALAPNTTLTSALGKTIGKNAVNNAEAIGVPREAYIWLDIEDYSSSSEPMEFCAAWASQVSQAMYYPAVYYGAPGLSASQVKDLLHYSYRAAWAGHGQVTGIGEAINQVSGPTAIAPVCNGETFTITVDNDTLLAGFTVGGLLKNG